VPPDDLPVEVLVWAFCNNPIVRHR
jgi:hypothetical protein